jgi:aldose 1-epimerase
VSFTWRTYGHLPTGESVEAFTLTSPAGLVVEGITYGGIVTRLLVPDREGKLADAVLGFNNLESYLAGHPYFGAITGRVAGRITGGKFRLDGNSFELAITNPPNHLHGGICGFDKKIWTAHAVDRPDHADSVRLTYRSHSGEEGYPGNVDVTVTYTATADNTFLIETVGVTDQPTPFNLTHHSYFNLAGEGASDIGDHELEIFADEYVPADEHMTLFGRLESVDLGNDFRQKRRLRDAVPSLSQNHGDMYALRENDSSRPKQELAAAARLFHPPSGRALGVLTTESYFQLYTGAFLDGSLIGKSGRAYGKYAGVCLECHGYPDGVNTPSLGDIILRPGHPFRSATTYAFSTVANRI